MPYENSRRYLNAFNEIEDALRRLVDADKRERFYELIEKAAQKDKSIKTYSDDLKEFADLRNAIVHDRIGGEPIAVPHYKTVIRIEKIRDFILAPPTVEPIFFKEVVTCKPDDNVSEVAKIMLKNSFSQIPIYDGEIFKGLLTTETISRWLADRLEANEGILMEESVGVVATFCEYDNNYRFISRRATLYDVLEHFNDFPRSGRNLNAIIITNSGKVNQKPLGIVTVYDLPEIYRTIYDFGDGE